MLKIDLMLNFIYLLIFIYLFMCDTQPFLTILKFGFHENIKQKKKKVFNVEIYKK